MELSDEQLDEHPGLREALSETAKLADVDSPVRINGPTETDLTSPEFGYAGLRWTVRRTDHRVRDQ